MSAIEPLQNLPAGIADYPPGIYPDIPAEVYHQRVLGVVNKGALDQIAKTPAHYRAWVDGADDAPAETPALLFGRALHCLVLEPELFATEWAEQPDFGNLRTKAAREARDAWLAEHPGITLLSSDDWQRLHAMREAVLAHPVASALLDGGQAEATSVWTDPGTGLLCKARMDCWRPDIGVIGDLKSTVDASPAAFARAVANYRYHVQQAHYAAGAAAHGIEAPTFVFVVVEKTPPYAVCLYQLDDDAADRGDELRTRDLQRLDACLQADDWPAYPPAVNALSLPAWAHRDD